MGKTSLGAFILVVTFVALSFGCRSKVRSSAVGGGPVSVRVFNPGESGKVETTSSSVTVDAGTFGQPVTVQIDKADASTVQPKTTGSIAGGPIQVSTRSLDGNPIKPTDVQRDITVTFTLPGTTDKSKLTGLILTQPDGRLIEIANSDLTITNRADGNIEVSFKTKEVNAIFAIISGGSLVEKEIAKALIPGSKTLPRQYYQTRNVISLQLDKDQIAGGTEFTIENTTTGHILVQDQKLSLTGISKGFALSPLISSDLLVSFFPLDPDIRTAFAYGQNDLAVHIERPDSPAVSHATLWVRDFDIFEPAILSFSSKREVSTSVPNRRFEGWIGPIKNQKVVAPNGSTLTTGLPTIVNH